MSACPPAAAGRRRPHAGRGAQRGVSFMERLERGDAAREAGPRASTRSSRARAVRALLLLACAIVPARVWAQDTTPPTLRVGALQDGHRVDGVLDEAAWGLAEAVDAFTQTDPVEGSPPSARTVVRVLASPTALVVGVECVQPSRGHLVSYSVRRDAPLTSEDHVRLVLGPFLDGRSGYVFAVNPSGARYDGLIDPGGEVDNPEWDGIWEAATRRRRPAGARRSGFRCRRSASSPACASGISTSSGGSRACWKPTAGRRRSGSTR